MKNSQKYVFSLVLVVAFLVVFASSAFAVPAAKVKVKGHVTNSGGDVAGASVVITCVHLGVPTVINKVTDSNGKYGLGGDQAEFEESECATGDALTVQASKDGESGNAADTAKPGENTLDIFISAAAVPEFGFFTGAVAGMASIAFLLMMKKMKSVRA